MSATAQEVFRCEINESGDEGRRKVIRVVCHGRLVAGDTETIRAAVYPLIVKGGWIIIDCSDLAFVDSMGLGVLVSLKVSSVHKGSGTLEFVHLSPRIK